MLYKIKQAQTEINAGFIHFNVPKSHPENLMIIERHLKFLASDRFTVICPINIRQDNQLSSAIQYHLRRDYQNVYSADKDFTTSLSLLYSVLNSLTYNRIHDGESYCIMVGGDVRLLSIMCEEFLMNLKCENPSPHHLSYWDHRLMK